MREHKLLVVYEDDVGACKKIKKIGSLTKPTVDRVGA